MSRKNERSQQIIDVLKSIKKIEDSDRPVGSVTRLEIEVETGMERSVVSRMLTLGCAEGVLEAIKGKMKGPTGVITNTYFYRPVKKD